MKSVCNTHPEGLAVLGDAPAFSDPIPVGQLYFPAWDEYEAQFRSIFDRQYYTNHGPLIEVLENKLAKRLQVRHALCVTNATIGLSMVAEALGIKGRVIVPAFTFIATAQSLLWSNLEPVFCDVDRDTHHFDFDCLEHLLTEGVSAILSVNLWGGACDMPRLEALAQRYDVPLYFDSAHGFGCVSMGRPLGGFGRAEVFSFHATKVMTAGEGGCISTNDDALAERLRNIRSSYGVRTTVPVVRTANGRMSEAQAAIGLLGLDKIDSIIAHNQTLHEAYRHGLGDTPGIKVLLPVNVEKSNFQYLLCEIDQEQFGLSRDMLQKALLAENIIARRYFYPGVHRCPPFKTLFPSFVAGLSETDRLCSVVLQLPLGASVDVSSVATICRKIHIIQQQAYKVLEALDGGGV